jgi:hypothetical protein
MGLGDANLAAHAAPSSAPRAGFHHHRGMRLLRPTDASLPPDVQRRLAGRYIAECGGRGDCLFHVMSFLGCGRVDLHEELRHAVADFYLDAAHAAHPVVVALAEEIALGPIDGAHHPSVAHYSEAIRRAGQMASCCYELPILAELLSVRVSVVLMAQVPEGSAVAAQLRDHVLTPPHFDRQVSLLYANQVSALLRARGC